MSRILRSNDNGAIYIWTPELAAQPQMVEISEQEQPVQSVDTPAAVGDAQAPAISEAADLYQVKLEAMTKEQIESYAKEEFGLDLDRRKSPQKLVSEVMAAAYQVGVIR